MHIFIKFLYDLLCKLMTAGRLLSLQNFVFYTQYVQSDKFSRFVQFGADQDCHCGAVVCRRKLGVRPTKPKMSSDAALKLVACQVAVTSPKLKAILSGKDVCLSLLAKSGFYC